MIYLVEGPRFWELDLTISAGPRSKGGMHIINNNNDNVSADQKGAYE